MPSLIPRSSYEVRPRLAVEIRAEAVVAARSNDTGGVLAQVARVALPAGAVVPSLHAGNIAQPERVAAAVREVLASMQHGKLRDVTLVIPDSAVRVVLLDFDTLPSGTEDALAVIRFRLGKLLPFPADAAQVSYQVMGERGRQLQVLAVAMPYAVLAEYESAVRAAGYEPGAVLPSTLAVASAFDDAAQTAALLVNNSPDALTTAILRRGELLLYRTLETSPAALENDGVAAIPANAVTVIPAMPFDGMYAAGDEPREFGADDPAGSTIDEGPLVESFVPAREYAAATWQSAAVELQRAVAVAAAYYEDSLNVAPEMVLTAGSLSATELAPLLLGSGVQARELLQPADLLATATTPVPPGLLAGLRGALRSGGRTGARL